MPYPKTHIGVTNKVYIDATPLSYRIFYFLTARFFGPREKLGKPLRRWVRHREHERLKAPKCYSN